MELINNQANWFLSEQGKKAFDNCKNLEERSVFIYSYLKKIAANSLNKDSFLFRIAFLLANSVHSSKAEYANYPELLDESKNPFVAYVKNAKKVYSIQIDYCILLSILHKLANPFDKDDWVYNQAFVESKAYIDKAKELEKCFIEDTQARVIDNSVYDIDEALRDIQIEIAWLFILQDKEGK